MTDREESTYQALSVHMLCFYRVQKASHVDDTYSLKGECLLQDSRPLEGLQVLVNHLNVPCDII